MTDLQTTQPLCTGERPYQVVHQVFQGSNSQHYHQGDQCRVPGQGGNVGDELWKET